MNNWSLDSIIRSQKPISKTLISDVRKLSQALTLEHGHSGVLCSRIDIITWDHSAASAHLLFLFPFSCEYISWLWLVAKIIHDNDGYKELYVECCNF